ncbi:restriction endonuclease subunit S [Roseovarius confluentis]|uniref:restriction endonuclease subunit S n=1 Tax=Roseovarius confluentis TaxID=1852027 RepID=UPI003BAA8CB6
MVPEGWEATTLGECVTFRSGGTPSKQKAEFWGGNIPWVSAKDLKSHRIEDAIDHLTEAGAASAKMADIDHILILVRGMTLLKDVPVGLVARPLAFNQDIKALVAKADIDPLFLSYLLVGRKMAMLGLVNTANHGTGRLDTDLLKGLPIDLPPFPEQRKIAEILSTWDRAIETTEALLATARTQKRAIMQTLLTGKRRFPEFEGQEWREVRLGDLGSTFTGLTGKSKEDFGMGLPYIPYLNIFQNSRIDPEQVDYVSVGHNERQNRVRFGDIFFTTSSETPNEVGMASVLLDDIPDLFLNSFCFGFRLHDFDTLLPRFARFMLRGQDFRRSIRRLAQGATRYNLSKTHLMNLTMVLPPVAEQERVADVLEISQTEELDLAKQIDKLRAEKKALMQQLLTGKRRVQA